MNIAYYALGHGPPLIRMPAIPSSHIQLQWQRDSVQRRIVEAGAEQLTFVQYECRGAGSSTREVTDFSLEAYLMDLQAVADHLGLERFALMGIASSGPVAITYAARYPRRLSHLILQQSFARGAEAFAGPEKQALRVLREQAQDWTLYTEFAAQMSMGWSGESGRERAAFLRESVTAEVVLAAYREIERFDVADILAEVTTPTLVFHQSQFVWPPAELSRSLAAGIEDATLVAPEGFQDGTIAIGQFLGVDAEPPPPEEPASSVKIHTILFTDVEGSTALTERLGDAKARDLLREHERITRKVLKAHGGSEVKTLGDGFMASFSSATKALECAIAIQCAFAERNESAEEPIRIRIGLNAGEPIAEDDPDGRSDLFGTAVNMAARIASKAEGGEILVADVVRQLVAGKDFLFSDRGDTEMRGFEDPVRLFEVSWREA